MEISARNYKIIIKRGALGHIGEYVADCMKKCKCVIVSDDNVHPLYASALRDSLSRAGFEIGDDFVFPHGEERKNLTTLAQILEHLASQKLTRSDAVIALGGGVTGDMAGFASAVYLRGIKYVQVPTSLLACVDSSVGGKTAVDLSYGKNLAGAFHEPSLVLCDPDLISTLPREFFADGMVEAIKMGVISDPDIFPLAESCNGEDLEKIIIKSVSAKNDIVMRDFTESGERKKLNLGHTVGHSIEVLSNFTVHHGHAVAAGLHIITKASVKRGLCAEETLSAIDTLLAKYFDVRPIYENFTADELYQAALHDKKMSGKKITLVIPRTVGKVDLVDVSTEELLGFIKDGID